ncbi:MAG: hypothetical protein IH831_02695 [Planctomycetes bacterium]|nr:hypothetical protein [Planctomycetota bacterium]
MKRSLIVVLVASMVVAFVGVAQAEHGMPSQATLRAMGLSGMQVMSDREAMGVRGMGYYSSRKSSRKKSTAIAFGISYAKVGGHYGASAGTIDGFFAKGKHFAAVKHGSKAGKVVIIYGGGHRGDGYGGGYGGPPKGSPKKTYTKGKGGPPQGPPHKGGGKGGGKKVKSIVVFAGGFAIAKAY